jgi:hypothetical protein
VVVPDKENPPTRNGAIDLRGKESFPTFCDLTSKSSDIFIDTLGIPICNFDLVEGCAPFFDKLYFEI